MACEPEVMQQEAAFLAALQGATAVRREGERLELRTADGALAVTATAASR
jgi:heat shock protein HslJ